MASTATVNDVQSTQLAVISENVSYERWSKILTDDADPTKVTKVEVAVVSNPSEADSKSLADKGFKRDFVQTVRVDKAGTFDGISQIVTDAEENVNIYNRGLAAKLNQKLNALFKDSDEKTGAPTFSATEDVYDPTELLNDPTQRRNLTPVQKAIKGLEKAGLSDAALQAAIAAIQAANAGSMAQ